MKISIRKNQYEKLGRLCNELIVVQGEIEQVKKLLKNHDNVKLVLQWEYREISQDKKTYKYKTKETRATTKYFLDFLQKEERGIRGNINRIINKKWYEFWKLW